MIDEHLQAVQDTRLRHARMVAADPGAYPRTERECAIHTLILLGSGEDEIGLREIIDYNMDHASTLPSKLMTLVVVLALLTAWWYWRQP